MEEVTCKTSRILLVILNDARSALIALKEAQSTAQSFVKTEYI